MDRSARSTASSLFICIILFFYLIPCIAFADDDPIIAIASNLSLPMAEIVEQYKQETGNTVRLTIGSSGNLARQIVQGAPYDLFISANRQFIDLLTEHGVQVNNIDQFIVGELGLYIPDDSQLNKMTSIDEIINALIFRSYRKLAIANPEHAPYGMAAMEALNNAGLWAIESSRVVLADSVSLVIPYTLSGSVDVAVIPYSFMLQNEMKQKGRYLSLPGTYYTPLIQYLAELKSVNTQTPVFKKFLLSDISRTILNKYGYEVLLKD